MAHTWFWQQQEAGMNERNAEGMDDTEREALNRRLAEWAGYKVERRRSGYYALILPNGVEYPSYLDERSAWDSTPKYVHSLDAGMALVPKYPHTVTFGESVIGGRYCVIDDQHGHQWSNVIYAAADSLALALALDALRAIQEAER